MKTLSIPASLALAMMGIAAAAAQTPERSTHGPSASEYPSIQAAIRANPGRMVYVPPGDYDIAEKLHIGRLGGGLWGPGRIRQTNPGQPILVVEGATGVQIRDLTLTRPEGKTDTQTEGVLAIDCRNLVLENLQVLDNRTRTAAVELRACYASQVRNCLVQNYQCVSVDDRTNDADSGYAFKCLIGTGIVLKDCRATLVQGNRVIEQRLFPTPEAKQTFHLGDYTKKNRVRGRFAKQDDWDRDYTDNWHQATGVHVACPTTTDFTQVLGNYVENSGQGFDIHADHVIVVQNIVKDTMVGMKAMHGSRNVLILGNLLYDAGRDGILVDGQRKVLPPRYTYAVHVATAGYAPPQGLHFSNNLLHPGTNGIANVDLPP